MNQTNQPQGIRLSPEFYQFILDYAFLCDEHRTGSLYCPVARVGAFCAKLLSLQEARRKYIGKVNCHHIFFNALRVGGVKDETLEFLDGEYGKLQDEKNRVAGMSREDFSGYINGAFKSLKRIGQDE